MKTIKKIKESSKAVAGSALLVGATLAGGAAFATASSHMGGSSGSGDASLGDYPGHFIGEDGTVSSTVVMGEDAASVDVVAGAAIAGQLGNNAFTTETQTVSTSSGVAGTFSAENGVTLNRQNSDLFLNDETDAEESRLDASNLDILDSTTFESYDSNEVDVEYEVNVGNQDQGFAAAGDLDDPVLHVTNPTNPTSGSNLMTATVEFSDSINFEAAGDGNLDGFSNGEEAIEDGDEIQMFGQPFTFSEESTDDELVFYGTSDRTEVNTGGETATVTVNGNELTVGATFVSDSNPVEATVTVDGVTENVEEGDSVGPNGNIRVTDIFRTGPDGAGRVAFSQGSDELVIQDNGDIEVDGDDIDGVTASFNGGSTGISLDSVDEIAFHFGAVDSDDNYIAAGEAYEDPLFGLQFHYGGLTGDTAENPAEAIEMTAEEDGAADVTVNAPNGEDSTTVDFVNNDNNGGDALAYESGMMETYATVEGQRLYENNRVVLNANEESGIYEVTDISAEADPNSASDEDYSVTVQNVVTSESITIEETGISSGDDEVVSEYGYNGGAVELQAESIEGKDFDVVIAREDEGGGHKEVVHFFRSGETDTQVFPTYYTSSDAGMVFTEQTPGFNTQNVSVSGSTGDLYEATLELPSTVVSGDATVDIDVDDAGDNTNVDATAGGKTVSFDPSSSGNNGTVEVTAGETVYDITFRAVDSGGNNAIEHYVGVDNDQSADTSTTNSPASVLGASVGIIQPEDDEDEEHAYFFDPSVSDGSDGSFTTVYTGETQDSAGYGADLLEDTWVTADLDSEDGVEVGYNDYGTYTRFDSDDDAQYNFHLPSGQGTAGMAVTGADGDLTEGGAAGGGTVETMTPTGFSSQYTALDSDSSVSSAKQNRHLVLVGGPAVNSVVGELVEANETMAASEYTEGQGMLQLVEDAFTEGHDALIVAGHSGEDTRAAGEFLVNHDENSDALEGSTQVTVNTAEGTVVQ